MPDKWEEMLPFYVAGTLDPRQRTGLERHLDDCETCRRSLNEWYLIGEAVRAEADSWARTLPLPRYNGQFGAMPAAMHSARRERPRRALAFGTLAASLIAVLLLGSLIAYMAARPKPEDQTASGNTGAVAVAATQTALANTLLRPTNTPTDLGLITNTIAAPTATPTVTIIFEPTKTTTPRGIGGGGGSLVQGTPVPTTDNFTTPIYGCFVRAAGPNAANIYRFPVTNGEVVDTLGTGDFLMVYTASGDGWFELLAPNIQLPGWVWGGDVVMTGADCHTLPLPTPTMAVTFPPCTALTTTTVFLRPDPFDTSPITARLSAGARVGVLTLSDNGWYMVQAIDSSTGWTPVESVSLEGNCTDLPYTEGYIGFPTATPMPTNTPENPPPSP